MAGGVEEWVLERLGGRRCVWGWGCGWDWGVVVAGWMLEMEVGVVWPRSVMTWLRERERAWGGGARSALALSPCEGGGAVAGSLSPSAFSSRSI